MTIDYTVYIDKNGDGFVNRWASVGDSPNLLESPVQLTYDYEMVGSNAVLRLERDDTPYGRAYWELNFLSSTAGEFVVGTQIWSISATPGGIAWSVGTTYTFAVWLRGDDQSSLSLTVYDGNKNQLATMAVPTLSTTAWTQVSITVTPGVGQTEGVFVLERSAGAVNVKVDYAGAMLVADSSAPATFNAGDDLDDALPAADVLAVSTRRGMSKGFEWTAEVGTCEIQVDNADKRHSPETSGTKVFQVGRWVHVTATYSGTEYSLFDGYVRSMAPKPGVYSPARWMVVSLVDALDWLDKATVRLSVYTDYSVQQVLQKVVSASKITGLFETDFDTGGYEFAWVGDSTGTGQRALTIAGQVVDASLGRFYVDREGSLVYTRRSTLDTPSAAVATISNSFERLDYGFGLGMANQVSVDVVPRESGSAGSTVWRLANAQKLEALSVRTIRARFRDQTSEEFIGATAVISPVATTDYTANTAADGTGTNRTAQVSISAVAYGGSIELTITNNDSQVLYLQPGSKVRGTPLVSGDPVLIEANDTTSVRDYGVHPLRFNLPMLDDIDEATRLVDYELARRKTPFGMVRSVTISADDEPAAVVERDLFDKVRLEEAQTGHSADYWIVGMSHNIDSGGKIHGTTWVVEPCNPAGWWQLGVSELGSTTRLGVAY